MPLGLYTRCEVTAPCGLCSKDGVIGLLDVPDTFLDPDRMRAGLLWFTRGFVEYQFPNNAKLAATPQSAGSSSRWSCRPRCRALRRTGRRTSPSPSTGRRSTPGRRRATSATSAASYTPAWWKLAGSQYGELKLWRVTTKGTFRDGAQGFRLLARRSRARPPPLDPGADRRARTDARHPGGINIFGSGFGNHARISFCGC